MFNIRISDWDYLSIVEFDGGSNQLLSLPLQSSLRYRTLAHSRVLVYQFDLLLSNGVIGMLGRLC